ncbi:hypothetical protein HXX76_007134 [Chlamydomonas incerta]|uniref:Potassium channel tetramerisation-type BTB domain-containing protein n=1 Tax=Chlamydomonas incerta TaxID=51695 RepID=A0A835SZ92_CHLIN|nr:hypothetical protein HXX76_007134 [Chlamydomonas incerta]|eukprot:KAG2435939.1 hypothetical protein HXX76_007134 [Chlamydomonas incerta]
MDANGTGPGGGAARPASSSTPALPNAAGGSGNGATSAATAGAAATAADEVAVHFARLTEAVDAKMRALAEKERSVEAAAARLSIANERMAVVAGRTGASDVIRLNVGGTAMATSRRTLTLLPDSLLATMFSGDWDDHLARDPSGAVFLDYDPALFGALLNWLRACDLAGPEAPLGEVRVEQERQEQLLVLVDFLQLQRCIPCRFTEVFSPTLSSPYLTLGDIDGSSAGYHTRAVRSRGGGGSGAYAVAATAHCYFDTHVELVLQVERFAAVRAAGAAAPAPAAPAAGAAAGVGASRAAASAGVGAGASQPLAGAADGGGGGAGDEGGNHPMFVGVMCRGQLAALDQSKRNVNTTWQSTCHGWWTHRRNASKVIAGQTRLLGHQPLWADGDTLILGLDAVRRSEPAGVRAAAPAPATAPAPGPAPPGAGAAPAPTSAPAPGAGAGQGASAAAVGGGAGGGGDGQLGAGGSVELSLTNARTLETHRLRFSADSLGGASEEQWVVVVGLAGVDDCVRIASARRVGMRPPRRQD